MKINKGKSKLPWQFTKEKLLLQQTEIWHTYEYLYGHIKTQNFMLDTTYQINLARNIDFLEMNEHKVYRTLKL